MPYEDLSEMNRMNWPVKMFLMMENYIHQTSGCKTYRLFPLWSGTPKALWKFSFKSTLELAINLLGKSDPFWQVQFSTRLFVSLFIIRKQHSQENTQVIFHHVHLKYPVKNFHQKLISRLSNIKSVWAFALCHGRDLRGCNFMLIYSVPR